MDSQDSSAPPPHLAHHHHSQPPPQSHHPSVFLGQHSQTQQHMPSNLYPFPNHTNTMNSTAPLMHQQNPRFPFNSMPAVASPAPKPLDHIQVDGSSSAGVAVGPGFSIEPTKKRRGRPRKYSPDNSIGLGLSPAPGAQLPSVLSHNDSGGGADTPASDTPAKRNRGRPPGSVKRQLDALGVAGVGFTPHVILVNTGEDVASKIMAFAGEGPRTVCILSANGAICNVTLRQPSMSGGSVTYEGRFEIISLSGSFQLSESNGNRCQTGGLSISLAGSDGRVLGGGVSGALKAASPVQVIVGSFIADGKKLKSRSPSSATPISMNFVPGGSPSPGGSSESGEENDENPLNHQGSGPYGNPGQPVQNLPPMYSAMGWPNSMKMLPN